MPPSPWNRRATTCTCGSLRQVSSPTPRSLASSLAPIPSCSIPTIRPSATRNPRRWPTPITICRPERSEGPGRATNDSVASARSFASLRTTGLLFRPQHESSLERGDAGLVVADVRQHLVVMLADLWRIAEERRPPAEHLEGQQRKPRL